MTSLPGRDRRARPACPALNRARTAAAVIATAAIATACGSGSPSASSGSGGSRYQQALKYSQCMRSHGVAGFPDPSSSPNGGGELLIHGGPGTGIDPRSNSFQAAQQACAKLLPGGAGPRPGGIPASARRQTLRFSACMRSHGVPNFPDPVFSGNGARLQLSGGLNPAAPAFKAAQKACGSPFPGGVIKNTSGVGAAG
jgi:hypothetical protein